LRGGEHVCGRLAKRQVVGDQDLPATSILTIPSAPLTERSAMRSLRLSVRTSDFQSEKTGSTPVGSAMNPLKNLVGSTNVCHFSNWAFATRGSFAVLKFPHRRLRKLPLIGSLDVVRHHGARCLTCDGFYLLFGRAGLRELARGCFAKAMQYA